MHTGGQMVGTPQNETTQGVTLKKLLALAAAALGMSLFSIAPAHAAGQLCYDVNVNVAGQAPIAQAGCQDLPTP